MDSRRLYDQVMTIFGTVMVIFYLGLGYILLFSTLFSYIDVALRAMFALPLFLYVRTERLKRIFSTRIKRDFQLPRKN
jgi:hypothetical protein